MSFVKINKQSGPCFTVIARLHVCDMFVTCLSHVCHMFVACLFVTGLSHVCRMFVTCWSHVCDMFVACLSHVCRMFVTCLSHVCHMFVTRLSHVCRMFVIWLSQVCIACMHAFRFGLMHVAFLVVIGAFTRIVYVRNECQCHRDRVSLQIANDQKKPRTTTADHA